jgi:hypothetical protein
MKITLIVAAGILFKLIALVAFCLLRDSGQADQYYQKLVAENSQRRETGDDQFHDR